MMDRRHIVELWTQRRGGVLVTLVRVEGSSYRRPGARLLTSAGGEHAGTISGGCLEADVVRRADWIVRDGAAVEEYATIFDDTAEIPYGLGCGGTLGLLFEPAKAPEGEALLRAIEASLDGRESTVVSFLPDGLAVLRRLVLDAQGTVIFASAGLSTARIAYAREMRAGGEYEGSFVERIEAPQRLLVLGAGEDAKPLVEIGALLGWTVEVADSRAHLVTAKRFPRAHRTTVLGHGVDLGIRERDAVIVMTHSYEQDRDLLTRVPPAVPRYLGLLGSRHRSSLLVTEAAAMLGRSVEACCDGISAPVGLDLGGDGPEAIALAVVAEVQAVASGRIPIYPGISRRLSAEDVALQIGQGGASRYLHAQCVL